MLCQSTFFCLLPSLSLYDSSVAMLKFATALPPCVYRTSGSLPNRPTSITLFTDEAIVSPSLFEFPPDGACYSFHQNPLIRGVSLLLWFDSVGPVHQLGEPDQSDFGIFNCVLDPKKKVDPLCLRDTLGLGRFGDAEQEHEQLPVDRQSLTRLQLPLGRQVIDKQFEFVPVHGQLSFSWHRAVVIGTFVCIAAFRSRSRCSLRFRRGIRNGRTK